MNNNENIIEIKDLKKGYDNGKIKALNGMNLKVKKGEFISIMGPSGSGKSSLLNMIGGLDIADEGTIKVAGIDMMKTKNLNKFRSKRNRIRLPDAQLDTQPQRCRKCRNPNV